MGHGTTQKNSNREGRKEREEKRFVFAIFAPLRQNAFCCFRGILQYKPATTHFFSKAFKAAFKNSAKKKLGGLCVNFATFAFFAFALICGSGALCIAVADK